MKIIGAVFILFLSVQFAMAFTDADLEKYKDSGNSFTSEETPAHSAAGNSNPIPDSDHQNDPQFWCNKAREINSRLGGAKAAYSEALAGKEEADRSYNSALFSRRSSAAQARAQASAALSGAAADLREARLARQNFEDDAHRLDIPAGWLRCQFE